MSSVLKVQQFYTAGIPLLEAYLLPMANNQTHKNVSPKNKMAATDVVKGQRSKVYYLTGPEGMQKTTANNRTHTDGKIHTDRT